MALHPEWHPLACHINLWHLLDHPLQVPAIKQHGPNLGTLSTMYATSGSRTEEAPWEKARAHAIKTFNPVLTNNEGTEIYLSYHVLGFCWSNCRHTSDHQKHMTAEMDILKE